VKKIADTGDQPTARDIEDLEADEKYVDFRIVNGKLEVTESAAPEKRPK
jgi:hypothetical protein